MHRKFRYRGSDGAHFNFVNQEQALRSFSIGQGTSPQTNHHTHVGDVNAHEAGQVKEHHYLYTYIFTARNAFGGHHSFSGFIDSYLVFDFYPDPFVQQPMRSMASRIGAALILVVLSAVLAQANSGHSYARTCPQAEEIIQQTINEYTARDRTIPAGLLRLHFHDCFVNGCDGSILLDSTPTDGTNVEKIAPPNNNSARGFEVIEEAKRRLERACPRVVSCADAVAIAARDSTVKMGGPYYKVQTGRYDGRVSSRQLAADLLPAPNMDVSALTRNFLRQGLSTQDLVVLSGAHTIGTSKCAFFARSPFDRLYNFSNTNSADRTVNPAYLPHLRNRCPPGSSNAVELDRGSEFRFDNFYYKNLEQRNGILTSDQVLFEDQRTTGLVKSYAYNYNQFASHFAQSMIKMGGIAWKTSANGEIRRVCNAVNANGHNSL